MTFRADARGKDHRMVEETKQPASDAERRGAGFGRGKIPVIRDDGREFESLGMAAIATFGCLSGVSKISRACKTGEPVRGRTFRFREGGAR